MRPSTASSSGIWSSPRSSRWTAARRVLRDRKGGLAVSPACSATHPGSRSKLKEQEFFAGLAIPISRARQRCRTRTKLIATLAAVRPWLIRQLYAEAKRQLTECESIASDIWPLPLDRTRPSQHLRRVRRGVPHPHRAARPVRSDRPDRHRHRCDHPVFLQGSGPEAFRWRPSMTSRTLHRSSPVSIEVSSSACLRPQAGKSGRQRVLRVLPARPRTHRGIAVLAHPGGDHPAEPEHRYLPGIPHPPRRRDHPRHLPPIARPRPRRRTRRQPLEHLVHARMFNITNDSQLFRTRDATGVPTAGLSRQRLRTRLERMLPLYEAKMIHHYDHRWATYDEMRTVRALSRAGRDAGPGLLSRFRLLGS